MGHIVAVARHREGVGGLGRNLHVVLRPVDELITRVGCGRQGAAGAFHEAAAAANGAVFLGIGRGGDGVDRAIENREPGLALAAQEGAIGSIREVVVVVVGTI